MQQRFGCEEIAKGLTELIHSVLCREEILWGLCPKMPEAEQDEVRKDVAIADSRVDSALKAFRRVTEKRLKDYSDAEVILAAFLFASIWHDARDFRFNSNRVGDLIGRHRPELIAELILNLTEGKSATRSFLELVWDAAEVPAGVFKFKIVDPKLLQRLVFGCACQMDAQ